MRVTFYIQQYVRVPASLHSCQRLKLLAFSMAYIGCTMIFTGNFNLHFPNDWWCWVFFLELISCKCPNFFFVPFLVGMILLHYESSLYILYIYVCFTPFFRDVLQIFPPILHLAFSLIVSFDKWKFWFWWSLINQIFHLWLMIMSNLINLCQIQSHNDFLLFSSKRVMTFSLIFTYIAYFESFLNV